MSITPNTNVFTALSLTDIARPQARAAVQTAAVRQAQPEPEKSGDAPRQPQVAEDFRREAVTPRRPTFQRLGQVVDLSV
jgi:hypothetical protein